VKAIRKFTVRAVLPESLSALDELAGNLRWSWHEPTRQLFEHIAPELWRQIGTDPVALLGAVDPARLADLAQDRDYVAGVNAVRDDLRAYLTEPRWYQGLTGAKPASIAYFSPEFGIAAALPQYSGGLGILAGDHLKSASDLGVPLVGVGRSTRPAISARRSPRTAGSWRATPCSTLTACPCPCCAALTVRRCRYRLR
jgi:starch phosphorylase